MKVFTTATVAQRGQVELLAASLAEHAPDWELEPLWPHTARERFDIDPEPLLARHGAEITAWWIAVAALSEAAAGGRPAVHLPAGAWLQGDPVSLTARLDGHPVLIGMRAGRDPSGPVGEPTREQLRDRGHLDPGLLAVDGAPASQRFLTDWRTRMLEALADQAHRQRRVPGYRRRWLLAGLDVARLRGDLGVLPSGWNLSGWNAWSVTLEATEDRLTVDGEPLVLLNMTDFDPARPYLLNRHGSRLHLSEHPALAERVDRYAGELAGIAPSHEDGAGWIGAQLPDGTVFDRSRWRSYDLARALGVEIGDVTTPQGIERLNSWLAEPAPGDLAPGISRYIAYRLLDERGDVVDAFAPIDGHSAGFVRWCHDHGRSELPIPDRFLPPLPEDPAGAAEAAAPTGPPRVRFSGYLSSVLGLGAAARGYADALARTGVPVTTVNVAPHQPDRPDTLSADYGRLAYNGTTGAEAAGRPDVDLIAVNVDGLERFAARLGSDFFAPRRIGLWVWEADPLPPAWRPGFHRVDEVWAMSDYSARIFAADSPVPVLTMAPPVEMPRLDGPPHRLGLGDGFLFLFIFDLYSTLARKNPLGLIDAFRRAFPAPGEAQLLIKTLNAPRAPEADEALRYAAADRPDIHIVDASLTDDEKNALIAGCDCYVSLHRSEGFGLTLAEAMALEKPVIATGYSGNLDFMNKDNSFLVDHTMTHVGPAGGIYPAEGRWAEPDLDHAAALMRQIHADPVAAAAVAAQGRSTILTQLSPQTRGAAMRRRLEELIEADRHTLTRR